jgi:hypothetical protein
MRSLQADVLMPAKTGHRGSRHGYRLQIRAKTVHCPLRFSGPRMAGTRTLDAKAGRLQLAASNDLTISTLFRTLPVFRH